MAEQTHLLITTTANDDVDDIVNHCKALKAARFDPITVVTTDAEQLEALSAKGLQAIPMPEINNKDEFARLFHAVQKVCASEQDKAGVIMVVPAAALEQTNPEDLRATRTIFWHEWVDAAVFGRPIFEEADKNNTAFVKVVAGQNRKGMYMSRGAAPYGADVMVADSGIRAYRFQALRQLAETEPSPLERTERISMLRALEANLGVYMNLMTSAA